MELPGRGGILYVGEIDDDGTKFGRMFVQSERDQLAAQLAPTGTIRATMLATNPIQGRVNASTGEVTGVVADLMKELGRRRGMPNTLTRSPASASQSTQRNPRQANSASR